MRILCRPGRSDRGQTLVETVFLIPVILLLIIAITWFARVLITRQQLVSAARYGTDLIAYTTLDENEIRREIRNYLSHRFIRGRKLDPGKLPDENIRVVVKDFPRVSFFAQDIIANPDTMVNMVRRALDPMAAVSSVEIIYPFEVPRIIHSVGQKSILVSARSEILSGTGCRDDSHKGR